jgi:hypothetical protein
MIAFSASIAWVRAFTAVSRAALRWRIIYTRPVPDFGTAVACPASTARAALSPRGDRVCRVGGTAGGRDG